MKRILILSIAVALLPFMADRAQADDFNPPPWRGDPLSVEAEWNFSTGIITSYTPDFYNVIFGSQGEGLDEYSTHIDGTGSWVPDPDGAGPKSNGAAYTGFVIHLANFIDNEPYKDIRLQLTGYMAQGGQVGFFDDPQFDITATPMNNWIPTGGGVQYNPVEDITRAWYDIRIWPNPDREDIWFNDVPSGVVIEQVRVDTISIPEPSSAMLIALISGLGLFVRRKFVL